MAISTGTFIYTKRRNKDRKIRMKNLKGGLGERKTYKKGRNN